MTFADLFAPIPEPPTVQPGRAESADNANPTLNVREKAIRGEREKECLPIGIESGLGLSALSALSAPSPPASNLVPLNVPFVEGERYRPAGATETRTRLDLYLADPTGPWIRIHGVLMVAPSMP